MMYLIGVAYGLKVKHLYNTYHSHIENEVFKNQERISNSNYYVSISMKYQTLADAEPIYLAEESFRYKSRISCRYESCHRCISRLFAG